MVVVVFVGGCSGLGAGLGRRQVGRRHAGGGVLGQQLAQQRRHAGGRRRREVRAGGSQAVALAALSSGRIGPSKVPVRGSTRSTRLRSQRAWRTCTTLRWRQAAWA